MTPKAIDYLHRANSAIAHGALTNSKRPETFVKGVYPTHMKRGFGAELWDVDDKRYIDYICGLGTNLFGYGNHEINEAITQQLKLGSLFSLGSTLEVEVAERFKAHFPYVEKVRFLKTGSEACSAAIRIARAYAGRSEIVSSGYHGWHDDFVHLTPPAKGVPDRDYMMRTVSECLYPAAIIVEPVITNFGDDTIRELRRLRAHCTDNDILLIFDETITGIRYEKLSVANALGIEPDISIFGKAIGGGLPISVVAGKAKFMDCDYFVSSTFAGDTAALASMNKVFDLLAGEYRIERLWDEGRYFLSEFNSIDPEVVRIEGYPTRGKFVYIGELTRQLFMQEACKAGILFGPTWFFNFHHAKYTHQVISMCRSIISRIKNGAVKAEGEPPQSPFAERVRQCADSN